MATRRTRAVVLTWSHINPGGGPSGYTHNLQRGIEALRSDGASVLVDVEFWGGTSPERMAGAGASAGGPQVVRTSRLKSAARQVLSSTRWSRAALASISDARVRRKLLERSAAAALRDADIVVLQGYQPAWRAAFAKRRGALVVYMPHSPSIFADEQRMLAELAGADLPEHKYEGYVRGERRLFHLADVVVFPSPNAARAYVDAFGEELVGSEIRHLLSGVPQPDAAGEARRGERLRVLFVGRYVTHKGFDLYLRAAAELAPRFPDVDFFALGSGPISGDPASPVIDLGWSNTPHGVVAESDVVVVPNRIAYFDLLPLEAAALGRGLVMTAVGGNVDQLALLPDSIGTAIDDLAEGIAAAIRRARDDPGWGAANVPVFHEHFTAERFARRWLDLLDELAARRRTAAT